MRDTDDVTRLASELLRDRLEVGLVNHERSAWRADSHSREYQGVASVDSVSLATTGRSSSPSTT
jgi:hypothetical protein